MNDFQDKNVMSGTFGELWCDNEYMAEVKKFNAIVDIEFADVKKARRMIDGAKQMVAKAEGSFTLHKVSSKMAKIISDNLKKGKQTEFKLISNLDDPDAMGGERIVIYNATPTKLTLADWDHSNLTEEEIPFRFTDWDFEDYV